MNVPLQHATADGLLPFPNAHSHFVPVPFGFYAIYRGKNKLRRFRAFQFIPIHNPLVSHMKEQRAHARPRGTDATT
jgi:hypothetical protein